VNIVRKVLEDPLRGIAGNAGWDGSIVVGKVSESKGNYGFDAATLEYRDLVRAGIIDPSKVVRSAIQNAASVAGLLLTTEALVADKPEKKDGGPMSNVAGMGGGMDDY
ncbi:MAG: TCP-1/cpn60 chaperonin family protein, partial [Thermodesulfobacteriota bacterium]